MPNPTVRKERIVVSNRDGRITERERSIRQNGDCSEIVWYRDEDGHSLLVWHLVYDADGNRVHGPEEKYRRPGVSQDWPPPGYE